MLCESCRPSLTVAAASGGSLSREAAAHLAVCESCSSRFAAEQVLFASIDHSLHAAANAEVPASLAARVRARLPHRDHSAARFSSWRGILVPGTALALAASLVLIPRFTSQGKPDRSAAASGPSGVAVGTENPAPLANVPPGSSPARTPGQHRRRPAVDGDIKIEPSIQAAFAQLVRIARQQPEMAQSFSHLPEASGVEIQPIEIEEIRWQPLASETMGKN